MFVRPSLVELRCPCRDMGASSRPIRTACKTLGGRALEHSSYCAFEIITAAPALENLRNDATYLQTCVYVGNRFW